jgi:hypothetical protein
VIHYAAVAGRPEAVERVRHRLAASVFDRRVFEGERSVESDPHHRWMVAAVHCADPLASHRLSVNEHSFAVVNGPVMCPSSGAGDVAARLLSQFIISGSDGVSADITGAWNFTGASAERGLRSFGDFSGQYPLYYAPLDGATVVSNRSRVVSDVVRDCGGWNLRSPQWVWTDRPQAISATT